MTFFVPAEYYRLVYISLIVVLTIYYYGRVARFSTNGLIVSNSNSGVVVLFAFFLVVFMGLRPTTGHYFGDTSVYARNFSMYVAGINEYDPDSKEWLFEWLLFQCSRFTADVSIFFLIVEIGYILPLVIVCKKLIKEHTDVALLFFFTAFSFFSFGTNGIRNGLACSLFLLAYLWLSKGNRKGYLYAILIFCIVYNIHRSVALPILCTGLALWIKKTKYYMYIWGVSIIVSLVAGGMMENFFSGLGFDDRMKQYGSITDDGAYTNYSFRWDFLLYSSMPILLGYYAVIKKNVCDKTYLLLLHTYILCNAFWVTINRVAYSNRFAYLSWFLYPLLLAYPLLKLPIFDKQGQKVALILMLHTGFTVFMWLIGKWS